MRRHGRLSHVPIRVGEDTGGTGLALAMILAFVGMVLAWSACEAARCLPS